MLPQASAQYTVPNMKHYTLDILEGGTGLPQASAQYTVPNMKILYLRCCLKLLLSIQSQTFPNFNT